MPYWIQSTLLPTPALIGLFLGLGLPWALVILPRRDWRDRVMVACLTLAFGPMLLTAYMFILGSVQSTPLLRSDTILIGGGVMALVGWALTWRKRDISSNDGVEAQHVLPIHTDEKLLIGLTVVALVIRWLGVAYWPSTAYDAQWVYAYEGKLYTLLGLIPTKISYYPQFLPLLHSYLQIVTGSVNDHAARAILPFLHLGSILAVYVLGSRLFNRRIGIFAMAIWALYPHVGEWSRYGDLEIPVTFMFTAASAFFVMAWGNTEPQRRKEKTEKEERFYRRRYALIAGLFLGIGMWTKPTMGAFIWGVALVLVVAAALYVWRLRRGQNRVELLPTIRALRPQLEVVVITGLVCVPLGAIWYIRNVLLGYKAIDFPDAFWQTLAAQSGVELGWPLLALLILLAWVWFGNTNHRPPRDQIRWMGIGLVLVLAGVIPSIYNSGKVSVYADRMGIVAWLLVGVGVVILAITLWRWAQTCWTEEGHDFVVKTGWLLLLALPYFVTWFISYSYHYRLSFAIVPLMLMPTAVLLAYWIQPAAAPTRYRRVWQSAWLGALLLLAIPGILTPLYDPSAGWDWLWTDKLPDDHARYTSGNEALMSVVDGLQAYVDQHDTPMHVVAPGIKRLPFFFPLDDIRIDSLPNQLDQLEGVTYFIYGKPETGGDFNTFKPGANQVLSALSLATTDPGDSSAIMRRAWGDDDGIFKYTVYELHLENRFVKPFINAPPPEGDIVFGNAVRFLGHDIGTSAFWPGRKFILHFYWQVLAPLPADYLVYIHLTDADGNLLATWDGPVTRTNDGNYYSTLSWQPNEIIVDERRLIFDNQNAALEDKADRIVIGLYDPLTNQRLPVTVNGQAAGDGYQLSEHISIVPKPAS